MYIKIKCPFCKKKLLIKEVTAEKGRCPSCKNIIEFKSNNANDKLIENKKGYKNLNAIIAILASLVTIIVSITAIITFWNKVEKIFENTEFLVDCSEMMKEPFDNARKIDIAIRNSYELIDDYLSKNENTSLRVFCGECKDENNTKLIVPFKTDNKDLIKKALVNINISGYKRPLYKGIIEAIADFNNFERFKDVNKTIIIITSGSDTCTKIPSNIITDKIVRNNINVYVVALKPHNNQKAQLIQMSKLFNGFLYFANNANEFIEILENILNKKKDSLRKKNKINQSQVEDSQKKIYSNLIDNKHRIAVESENKFINERIDRFSNLTREKSVEEKIEASSTNEFFDYSENLFITTKQLPYGLINTPYLAYIEAEGGKKPYKWSKNSIMRVFQGIEFSVVNNRYKISGIAKQPIRYNRFTVTVKDSNDNIYYRKFDLSFVTNTKSYSKTQSEEKSKSKISWAGITTPPTSGSFFTHKYHNGFFNGDKFHFEGWSNTGQFRWIKLYINDSLQGEVENADSGNWYLDKKLDPGINKIYILSACNYSGCSRSEKSSNRIINYVPTPDLSDFIVSKGDYSDRIEISIFIKVNGFYTYYKLWRSNTNSPNGEGWKYINNSWSTSTHYIDKDIKPNEVYYYFLQISPNSNGSNDSQYSPGQIGYSGKHN